MPRYSKWELYVARCHAQARGGEVEDWLPDYPDLNLEAHCAALNGERYGERDILFPLRDRSFATVRFNRDGSAFLYECGNGHWKAAKAYVESKIGPVFSRSSEDAANNRAAALRIWEECAPIRSNWGRAADTYLASRGIRELPPNDADVLGYHPKCPWGRDTQVCMVALFRDITTDAPVAIHRTAVFISGAEKRRTLGSTKNAAIKLWREPRDGVLVVGEGIETVLSAALVVQSPARGHPAWAMSSNVALTTLPVIPAVKHLIILVDNDESGAGARAAAACMWRWRRAGRTVTQLMPKNVGDDFNSIAQRTP